MNQLPYCSQTAACLLLPSFSRTKCCSTPKRPLECPRFTASPYPSPIVMQQPEPKPISSLPPQPQHFMILPTLPRCRLKWLADDAPMPMQCCLLDGVAPIS
ncbi:hypothetical protein LI328DRAFT_159149 [Trichoderma asperelloides]|nr:hypothetical protein LI328DRAFT_159149 [Trichoderma asperelloides]